MKSEMMYSEKNMMYCKKLEPQDTGKHCSYQQLEHQGNGLYKQDSASNVCVSILTYYVSNHPYLQKKNLKIRIFVI